MLDDRLKEIFTELIAINATSGNEAPVAGYISNFLKNLGIPSRVDGAGKLSGGNCGNLIAEIEGGGDFFLASHMDTPRETLHVKPCFLDDRIVSDGNTILGVDNRAGVSAILYAVERATKKKLPIPCTLLFTVCEETSLAGSLFYEPGKNIRYGFIFDSHLRPGSFVSNTCGALTFKIRILGKSAHAGVSPEKGVNAIKIAAECMTHFPFGRVDEVTTVNIGIVEGGNATNVVCDLVTLTGEIRTDYVEVGETMISELFDKFRSIARANGGDAEMDFYWDFLPYHILEDSRPYVCLKKVMTQLGLEIKGHKSMGGSDANSFNAKGIPSINLGIGAQNPHGKDEFILYEDLQMASDIALHLIEQNE